MVYKVTPFVPYEIIAKASLSQTSFKDILLENHFIRLAHNENFICKVYEEIIAYSEKEHKIVFLVAIIESAEEDLLSLSKIWSDQEKQERKMNFFIPEKLEFICLKAMQALNYLH